MTDECQETEKRATSVPLPTEDGGERVLAQQNAGPESEGGSGEWPSPQTPATGPAPGTTPEGSQAASRREQAPPQHPSPHASATQDTQKQEATDEGDRGPARSERPPTSISQALDADPVASGSGSVPDDDEAVDTTPS